MKAWSCQHVSGAQNLKRFEKLSSYVNVMKYQFQILNPKSLLLIHFFVNCITWYNNIIYLSQFSLQQLLRHQNLLFHLQLHVQPHRMHLNQELCLIILISLLEIPIHYELDHVIQ